MGDAVPLHDVYDRNPRPEMAEFVPVSARSLLEVGRSSPRTAAGVLDRSHLRFFTRTEIVDLFERSGYEFRT